MSAASQPLCRRPGHTCGGCCWGPAIPRHRLQALLQENGRSFAARGLDPRTSSGWAFLRHEWRSTPAGQMLLGLLSLLPVVRLWFHRRLGRRLVCAYAAFGDDQERRLICLLHPSRWQGCERRAELALRLTYGYGCGEPGYYCESARHFAQLTSGEQAAWDQTTADLDWYDYSSRAVRAFAPTETSSECGASQVDDAGWPGA